MKKEYVEFINLLHGYTIRIKEIHWATKSDAEHRLCDEICDEICELEDRFAECAMGEDGKSFRIGDLKPMLPNSTDLLGMLKELEDDTKQTKFDDVKSLMSIIDDILEFCNKYKYRSTQV